MIGKRWIEVPASAETGGVHTFYSRRELEAAFDAAEGQRVETIHWCGTKGHGHVPDRNVDAHRHIFPTCVIVDATLILPPEAAS